MTKGHIVSETQFDMSNGSQRYALNYDTRSLVLDFHADAFGNAATGMVAVHIGENMTGLPWAVVNAGTLLTRPVAISDGGTIVTLTPIGACTGILHIAAISLVLAASRT